MSKDAVADWDTTAANNTDVGGISIAEGMPPANVNNAMREMMAQLATFNAAISPNVVPIGAIIMWSGSVANIPTGWRLCDGTNSTPDLRGRFIVGAGGSYAVSATGGAATVTLTEAQIPAHTHAVTGTAASAGSHSHTMATRLGSGVGQSPFDGVAVTNTITTSADLVTAGSAGAHTHSVTGTAASTGGGQSHENRPPYYALAYIMRTA